MTCSELDRNLIERCIARHPGSWEAFVDQYLGVILHAVNHSAQSRSVRLSESDREDLVADVFTQLIANDFGLLRKFRGESQFATYLTVIARRIIVRDLLKRKKLATLASGAETLAGSTPPPEERLSNSEEIERLLKGLKGAEADVVRLYHLEGKSYQEISHTTGMPENSVGPTLSRAREKLRTSHRDLE